MSRITEARNYDLFKNECRFFYCQNIYEGDWYGKEKYILSSDTPESELWERYPEIMELLSPYFFCNAACGDIYAESDRNISKFAKRTNAIATVPVDELKDELTGTEIGFDRLIIDEALAVCTPIQRERIEKYYLYGLTLKEIADGQALSGVRKSIVAGLARMKKFFEEQV